MSKKNTLERVTDAAARQAEALATLVTSVPAGTLPEAAVANAMGEVVNQMLTVVSPLAVEIENEAAIKRKVASQPRKAITEAQLREALNAHIVRCRITGRHAASKGWKGAVAHHLKMDPRTLRWPLGWDEAQIIEYLESR